MARHVVFDVVICSSQRVSRAAFVMRQFRCQSFILRVRHAKHPTIHAVCWRHAATLRRRSFRRCPRLLLDADAAYVIQALSAAARRYYVIYARYTPYDAAMAPKLRCLINAYTRREELLSARIHVCS